MWIIRFLKRSWTLLSKSAKKYKEDDPVRLAGTTAYFTMFALAPIIIIIVTITGLLIGEDTIREKLFSG